jgi:protein TonB
MFEDSTFESTGSIKTRSRNWMIATFFFNGSILLGLILVPLVYPEALPRQAFTFLLTAPTPPPTPQPEPKQPAHPLHSFPEMGATDVFARARVLLNIGHLDGPEQPLNGVLVSLDQGNGLPDGATGDFASRRVTTVVNPDVKGPMRISSIIVAGLLLYKPAPSYPLIAKAAGIEGTVVLQAAISKNGTIVNLRVVSGPAMLQQAALDAVRTWRYRPYLLNNQPVEVETTVNVVFTLGR